MNNCCSSTAAEARAQTPCETQQDGPRASQASEVSGGASGPNLGQMLADAGEGWRVKSGRAGSGRIRQDR